MDGKKVEMTDEEIVASFECCRKNDLENTCAYCVGCPASNYYAFNYEGDEECIAYVMRKAIEAIQRLTEENAILKGNPTMCVGRNNGKTIRAKLLAFDRMKEQNAELQKQVDELKELSEGYFKKAYFYYQKCKAYGIENFYDDELEPKPAKEGKTITIPKFEHIEVE